MKTTSPVSSDRQISSHFWVSVEKKSHTEPRAGLRLEATEPVLGDRGCSGAGAQVSCSVPCLLAILSWANHI